MTKLVVIAWWSLVVVTLGACFSPAFQDGKITCGADETCPPGLTCYSGACYASDPGPQDAPLTDVTLTVSKSGAGTGTVTSLPAGIDCGSDCSNEYPSGTQVTLTAAVSGDGSVFTSWGGACSGTSTTCSLTLTGDTAVTATFGVQMHTVTVVNGGNGTGTVTSFPAGIDCPGTCTLQVAQGGALTLNAAATAGSTFVGFSGGGCAGSGPCALTVTADVTVNASFALNNSVVVTKIGTGTGTVTSAPVGIDCGADCSEAFSPATVVTLTAAPSGNSRFVGWTGDCAGSTPCMLTVNAAAGVIAEFALLSFPLDVIVTGNGTVTGTGINCPGDCNESFDSGTTVTLTATEMTGAMFTGWGDGCTGMGACVVTVTAATRVTATFVPTKHPVTVMLAGTGTGTVTSTPGGIACPGDCTDMFDFGSSVTLTAAPAGTSVFGGWTGDCTGMGPCVIPITAVTNANVTATFNPPPVTLNVMKLGTGDGMVTSTPAGISCGSTCSAGFPANSAVSFTAMQMPGSTFTTWGGACSGNTSCVVTADMAKTVTATFTRITHQVSVTIAAGGTTGNSVSSSPGGIACPNDCMEAMNEGTMLRLTASAATGMVFTGWSGVTCQDGAMVNPCLTNVTAPIAATASFGVASYVLTVAKQGNGFGTVTAGAFINCGTDCTETVNHGTNITLSATPASAPASDDSVFTGWSGGGCTGMAPCTVTMTAATTVTANFALRPNRMFVSVTTFPGNFGGLAQADTLCTNLANMANLGGQTWRAWLSTSTTNAITRFAGASGWVRTDGKPFANTLAALANGDLYNPAIIDQSGNPVPHNEALWTATTVGGVWAGPGAGGDCAGWTATAGDAAVGTTSAASAIFHFGTIATCSSPNRLVCFQLDRAAVVIPPPPPGPVRRAFQRLWTPGGGLAGADAACQMDATAAGLPGTYRALLPTSSANAISRFDTSTSSRPWARVDNGVILPSAFAWQSPGTFAFDTGPNVTADGLMWFGNYVNWSGATSFTTTGTAATTCNNWTDGSATGTGTYGIAGRTPLNQFWATSTTNCNFTSGTITCLQE